MIREQKIGLILTAIARYPVIVAHFQISSDSFKFYSLLFYARGPLITRDGLGETGVLERWGVGPVEL